MNWLLNGLPIHVLLVHFVVVVVPLAALCLVLSTFWPAARRRLGIVTPIVAFVAMVSVPITTHAGEVLQEQVTPTALSELHVQLGKNLLPWAIGLFLVAAAQWAWYRFCTGDGRYAGVITSPRVRTAVVIVLAVAAVAVMVGSVVEVVIIGESGARAVWDARLK